MFLSADAETKRELSDDISKLRIGNLCPYKFNDSFIVSK
jgi:hypothetical protein